MKSERPREGDKNRERLKVRFFRVMLSSGRSGKRTDGGLINSGDRSLNDGGSRGGEADTAGGVFENNYATVSAVP